MCVCMCMDGYSVTYTRICFWVYTDHQHVTSYMSFQEFIFIVNLYTVFIQIEAGPK